MITRPLPFSTGSDAADAASILRLNHGQGLVMKEPIGRHGIS